MPKFEYLIMSNFTSDLEKFRILTKEKVEYKQILDDDELIKVLGELGDGGWELCSHLIHDNWNFRYIFKRPNERQLS